MKVRAQILTDSGVYPVVLRDVTDQMSAYNAIMLGLDEQQLFEGADELDGKLVSICNGAQIKHIVMSALEEDEPLIGPPSPEYARQEGPVAFTAMTSYLGRSLTISGIRYIYQKRAGLFGSIYLPQDINGKPALDLIDIKNIQGIVTSWRRNLGDNPTDFIVLVPPGELSVTQAAEYCQDYVKLLKAETPHVAREMTAKAYWGHKRSSVAEE